MPCRHRYENLHQLLHQEGANDWRPGTGVQRYRRTNRRRLQALPDGGHLVLGGGGLPLRPGNVPVLFPHHRREPPVRARVRPAPEAAQLEPGGGADGGRPKVNRVHLAHGVTAEGEPHRADFEQEIPPRPR
uniref:(northern house mosquito) hypothetical protein n=1 Tax=Culex pipiens TaxID=7175 RepID=A0A8D8E758_CULPI